MANYKHKTEVTGRLVHIRNNLILILRGKQKTVGRIKEQIEATLNFDDTLKKIN